MQIFYSMALYSALIFLKYFGAALEQTLVRSALVLNGQLNEPPTSLLCPIVSLCSVSLRFLFFSGDTISAIIFSQTPFFICYEMYSISEVGSRFFQ